MVSGAHKGRAPDKPGFHDIQEDTAASFSLEHDSAGQLVAVAFTDEEALRNWNKSIPWIALQGTAFFQAVLGTQAEEIVINPFEPEDPASKMIRPGGRVTRWEFEALAQGLIPQDQPDDDADTQPAQPQSVLVTMPKAYALRGNVQRACRRGEGLSRSGRQCISPRSLILKAGPIGLSPSNSLQTFPTNTPRTQCRR